MQQRNHRIRNQQLSCHGYDCHSGIIAAFPEGSRGKGSDGGNVTRGIRCGADRACFGGEGGRIAACACHGRSSHRQNLDLLINQSAADLVILRCVRTRRGPWIGPCGRIAVDF